MTLRERLEHRSVEELLAIAHYWGVSAAGPDGRPSAEALAARMAAESPIRTAFDRLTPGERETLRTMDSAAHKGWVATAHVRRLTGIPDLQVADIAASLERKAIAFSDERDLPAENPYWGPTWAGRKLPTTPTPVLVLPEETATLFLEILAEYTGGAWYADTPSPLSRLETLPLELLHAMAAHYEIALDGIAHSATKIASRLQAVLKDPTAVWRVITALPEHLRAPLDAAEAAGGRIPIEEIRERFAPEYEELHALVRELSERGLAFDRFVRRTRMLVVPERVLEAIARNTLPVLPRAKLAPVAAPAGEVRRYRDLHWSLLQLTRHIRLEGLSRTATTHAVPKRVVARLLAHMQGPPAGQTEEEWIEQLIVYLVSAGVLTDTVHLRLAEPEPRWLHQDAFGQAQTLLGRWLEGHTEDLRQVRCDLGLWMDRALLAAGRSLLVDLLRRCRPEEWISVGSLLRTAAGLRPHFLREYDRILRQQGYRGLKRMLESWFQVEGRVLLMHLTGLPFELGAVALDRPLAPADPSAADAAFRVTEWGASLLGTVPAPAPPAPEQALVVQPSFEVIALEFVPEVLDALGQFATPIGYDRVATYRLEHRGVNLAAANGWDAERILETLRTHARAPIPQNVEQSLQDWCGSVRRARFLRALVIEADDPAVLEDLASVKLLRDHVREMAHGQILLIQPDADLKQIARELRAEGFVLESRDE